MEPKNDSKRPSTHSSPPASIGLCRALFAYKGEKEGDLSFSAGEIIHIIQKNPKWWAGVTQEGRVGVFPRDTVQEIDQLAAATSSSSSTEVAHHHKPKSSLLLSLPSSTCGFLSVCLACSCALLMPPLPPSFLSRSRGDSARALAHSHHQKEGPQGPPGVWTEFGELTLWPGHCTSPGVFRLSTGGDAFHGVITETGTGR